MSPFYRHIITWKVCILDFLSAILVNIRLTCFMHYIPPNSCPRARHSTAGISNVTKSCRSLYSSFVFLPHYMFIYCAYTPDNYKGTMLLQKNVFKFEFIGFFINKKTGSWYDTIWYHCVSLWQSTIIATSIAIYTTILVPGMILSDNTVWADDNVHSWKCQQRSIKWKQYCFVLV
jgi:hypothetical protein